MARKQRKEEEVKRVVVDQNNDTSASSDVNRKKREKKRNSDGGRFVRNTAFALIVVVLLGTISCLVASQFFPEMKFLDYPRRAVAYVMRPVQQAFSSGTGWFFDYIERLKIRSNIEYEYEQLYDKYDELLSEVMLVNELQTQLDEYAELMDEMETHSQFDGVAARVIVNDTTNYFSTFTINVGTKHGVENYMAVVKAGGLVGYTYDVTETTAKVQSIINSDTSISALIESTRYQGTVKGTLGINGEPMCRMYYLSENHLPRQGDVVVTSGVGVEFPKGIPIGIVRESTRGLEEGKSYVVIEPIVDFERIEHVIVYRYVPSYAEQAEQRDEEDSALKAMPTTRPVPTFAASGSDAFNVSETATPSPDEVVPSEAPEGSTAPDLLDETPAPGDETPIPDNGVPTFVPNLSYGDIPGTPTPEPTPTPTPSPSPTPTFSLSDLTQEED